MSELPLNQIIEGDAVAVLRTIRSDSIDLGVTSPAYFGLRTYTNDPRELGLEISMHDYLKGLCDVFAEFKRILKPTGNLYVNLGNTFNGDKKGVSNGDASKGSTIGSQKTGGMRANERVNKIRQSELPEKCLLQIPQRFSIMMTDELGYCLRDDNVWEKLNGMPQPASDNRVPCHEYIYHFVKKPVGYFYEKQYEPFKTGNGDIEKMLKLVNNNAVFGGKNKHAGYGNPTYSGNGYNPQLFLGRGARDVLHMNTQGRSDAHFAAFPDELPRFAILEACPQYICKKCGFMCKKEYSKFVLDTRPGIHNGNGKSGTPADPNARFHNSDISTKRKRILRVPTGKLTDCGCQAGWRPGVVLDMFCGRGTTCIVARELGRDFIGIDLNPEFCKMARNNLAAPMIQDITHKKKKTKRCNLEVPMGQDTLTKFF